MQRNVSLLMLFAVFVNGDSLAQGHPDSSGETKEAETAL
jgi:hypothetical protein